MSALRLVVQRALPRADAVHAPRAATIRRWARAALRDGAAEVTVRLVGETEGRQLNRDYRGKDYATNVLSFVYGGDGEGNGGGEALPGMPGDGVRRGDLVLCVPVVAREAATQGKAVDAHFAHLVVHGMLHLQGFDHEDDVAAMQMESVERELMSVLGYPDPYRADAI